MPLYEYECESCSKRFERIRKYSDPPLETCPSCGGQVKKLFSSPAIQFKGSGFYITDYPKKSSGDGASGKSTGSSSSEDKGSDKDKGSSDKDKSASDKTTSTTATSSSSDSTSKKD